jgi:hypothetical protein
MTKKTTKKTTRKPSTKKTSKTVRKSPKKTKTVEKPIDRLQAVYSADGTPEPETVVAAAPPPKRKPGRPRKIKDVPEPSPNLGTTVEGSRTVVVGELEPEQPVHPAKQDSKPANAAFDGKSVVMAVPETKQEADTKDYASSVREVKNGVVLVGVPSDEPQ